jgi:23S rRNA (adenine2503-C2)-methyltransferase
MKLENQKSFYNLDLSELESHIDSLGYKKSHGFKIFKEVYKNRIKSFHDIPFIQKELLDNLSLNFSLALPKVVKTQVSEDDVTIKFLTQLHDGKTIETVLVPFNKKYTVCISSQVGCAMKCSFCYTGTQGLTRHLSSNEIVTQYLMAYEYVKENYSHKSALPNIVFMGQGEPLHNLENVKRAIKLLLAPEAMNLGPRQITLSTAGYLPGLEQYSQLENINLALSFHSPFNDERSKLIPLNNAYPIEDIISELKKHKLLKRQFFTFEYLVLKDVNHFQKHADEIERLLKGMPVIFNLIPFNEFPGCEFKRPEMSDVESFKEMLVDKGFHTMVRTTKGDDILAACGQLNSDYNDQPNAQI